VAARADKVEEDKSNVAMRRYADVPMKTVL